MNKGEFIWKAIRLGYTNEEIRRMLKKAEQLRADAPDCFEINYEAFFEEERK